MVEERQNITVKVLRQDPTVNSGKAEYQSYSVPLDQGATVLSVLRYISENVDRTLSYYRSCRIGKCAGCRMRINGKTRLACTTAVTGDIVVEPLKGYEVVKDLVVDMNRRVGKDED
jgi:succinate dehydrogenase / fumarate reductase iron-sulfur subunit